MSGFLPALPDDVVRVLGVTLLHFLWQGAALALILKLILRGSNTPQRRYVWSMGTLCVMGATPVLTFIILRTATQNGGFGFTPTPDIFTGRWEGWLVGAWLFGVAALTAKALGELGGVYRLRKDAALITGAVAHRCLSLCERMATGWKVTFKVSAHLDSPVVVGWLKPVVLIPVSALTRMPMDELEALILHELAHIRRLDPFWNLLQITIETLLFYHPAVWWVSRMAREEREHCCDDLAVSAIGSPAPYVRALANIEEARSQLRMTLAANGGGTSISVRAKRLLLGSGPRQGLTALRALSFILVLTITALGWGTMRGPQTAYANTSLQRQVIPEQGPPSVLSLIRQSANIAIGMPPAVPSVAVPNTGGSAPAIVLGAADKVPSSSGPAAQPALPDLVTAAPTPLSSVSVPVENTPPVLAGFDNEAAARAEVRAREIARQTLIVQQATNAYSQADAAVIRAQLDVEKTVVDLQKAAQAWVNSRQPPPSSNRSALASRMTGQVSSQTVAEYLVDQPIGKQYSAQMAALDEARKIRAQARADQVMALSQLDALSAN